MTGKTATGARVEPASAPAQTHDERTTQRKATETLMTPSPTPTDLSALRAQRKALDEAIRAAQATQPRATPLDREIARQQDAGVRNSFVGPFYAKLIARRVALGQPAETAQREVAALWERWTLAALAGLSADPTSK